MTSRTSSSRASGALRRGVAALGCAALALSLGGCELLQGPDGPALPAKARPRPKEPVAHVGRVVGSTYEGINLHRDGTYDRTVVDRWGRAYQHRGTWRGYGGTYDTGRTHISRQLELNSYAEPRDLINRGTHNAPTSTKRLFSGDFYTQ